MSGPANDNEVSAIWASRVGPRDETAPNAQAVGMKVQAPLTEERLALALQTLEDGLSVLVLGTSRKEASDAAWQLVKSMSPADASR